MRSVHLYWIGHRCPLSLTPGSNSGWFSNQASRRLRTSVRCCSAACAVFFERDVMAVKEAPNRADAEIGTPPGQALLQFGECDVLASRHCLQDEGAIRL